MSKQLKFRAWDKYTSEMLEQEGISGSNSCISFLDFYYDNSEDRNFGSVINDLILMQFTGLLDKNGKKIFENDIVCWTFDEKAKKEIVFHEGCFGHFNFMGINNEYSELIPIHKKRAEYMIVCGNIYQNPELLGGQDE